MPGISVYGDPVSRAVFIDLDVPLKGIVAARLGVMDKLFRRSFAENNSVLEHVPEYDEIVGRSVFSSNQLAMYRREDSFFQVTLSDHNSRVEVEIWSPREEVALALDEEFRKAIKLIPDPSENMIMISFWSMGSTGPSRSFKNLEMPTWGSMEHNYPPRVREQIWSLIEANGWEDGKGKMILFRGDPGGGKTWSIRALALAWKRWCDIHVVTDPEEFLRSGRNYMQTILSSDTPDDRWKLIVLEDAGEFLAADAARTTGQGGLARLLNTVDGFMGQSSKTLFLITTNDDVKSLHKAVTRAGRCAMDLDFVPFDVIDAEAWCKRHDIERSEEMFGQKVTLAELYELKSKITRHMDGVKTKSIGFGAA